MTRNPTEPQPQDRTPEGDEGDTPAPDERSGPDGSPALDGQPEPTGSPAPPGRPDAAGRLLDGVEQVVLGQSAVVRQLLVTLLAGGHALVEGVPGTAKTLAVRTLAKGMGLEFGRVQFTPDLMPADLVGVNVLDEAARDFVYRPGPVFAELLLADEINRAPPKTQAALLEAMAERQVTVDGKTRPLPEAFTVFATQNPVEHEGTYPLPEAQVDRFLMKIVVDYPPEAAERSILDRYDAGFRASDESTYPIVDAMTRAELLEARGFAGRLHVDERIRRYVTKIVRATRQDAAFALGASPRAGVALFQAARAQAYLDGRDFVTPDDVKLLSFPVLRHRVVLTPEAEVEGRSSDDELRALLETLEAPR